MAEIRSRSKKRIFLVDDHALVREWLGNLINQRPDLITCGEAEDAEGAMKGIAACKPDVIIVDLVLKDLFGVGLIKEIKRLYPQIAILVLSMHEEAYYVECALRSGATGYVTKREATRGICEAIYRVSQGKTYISESVGQTIVTHLLEGLSGAADSSIRQFSEREMEVFQLLGQGHETSKIADTLRISSKTVQAHYGRMQKKLHLGSIRELLREAIRWNQASRPE